MFLSSIWVTHAQELTCIDAQVFHVVHSNLVLAGGLHALSLIVPGVEFILSSHFMPSKHFSQLTHKRSQLA